MVAWRWCKCYCHAGLTGGFDGYPRACSSCNGMGGVYVTERGARAEYPGGPFIGSDSDHSEWNRGTPVQPPDYGLNASDV